MSESGEAVEVLLDRLEATYGRTDWEPRFSPLDELVSCILSQHSNDKNSFPAFDRLRAQHPEWKEIVQLGPEHLASVVKSAGLANQKARSIIGCLDAIEAKTGGHSLDFLSGLEDDEARNWLLGLPGVGQKTAAIVLCFALGRDVVPVDTHVFRVSWRLGLIPKAAGEAKAHALLDAIVPPGLAYRFHMALIRHGRAICKALKPNCPVCPLTDRCAWFRASEGSG